MEWELQVAGMTCGNCVRHVTHALEGVAGVDSAVVDLEAGTAQVVGDATTDALIAAVKDAGYDATTG